jgi:hypothetical protein
MKLKSNNVGCAMILAGMFAGVVLAAVLPLTMLYIRNRHSGMDSTYRLPLSATWGVVFLILIGLNLVSFLKVATLRRFVALNEGSSIARLLTRIQVASVQLTVASLGAFVSLCVCLATSNRSYYSDPGCYLDWDDIIFRSARLFLLYGTIISVWFVQGPIMCLVSKTASTELTRGVIVHAANNKTNSSKDHEKQRRSAIIRPTLEV